MINREKEEITAQVEIFSVGRLFSSLLLMFPITYQWATQTIRHYIAKQTDN